MMAPDYTHWHGMYEVAERFYMELVPEVREMTQHGRSQGHAAGAAAVDRLLDEILARPEHRWFQEGAAEQAEAIRQKMQERYGRSGD